MKTRFFLFIFLFPIFVFSQINEADSLLNNNSENRIEKEINECDENIIMSDNIKNLLNKFIDINKSKGGIKGYCVQIYLGNDRDKARRVKHVFMRKYSEISPISYERINPNWKVRVGQFRTKLEAEKLKNEIIKNYPHCFIVDIIIPLNQID